MSHGAPCFYVQSKKALCRYHDHHRGDDRISIWCPVPPEMQDVLVAAKPEQFFKPKSSASGVFGNWIAMYIDSPSVDWSEVANVLREAFKEVAPQKLIGELERG